MSITGHAETGPTRAGFAVCDVLSGAPRLRRVERAVPAHPHRQGAMVDVSMLEATLAFLSGQVADYSVAGHRQQLSGNQAVSRRPTANLFKAGEGYLLLAVNSEKQYRADDRARPRRCAGDPRFADWFARRKTSRRCGPSSRRRCRRRTRASGKRSWMPRARPAPASGRSRK
jgi:Predicted acyl-CoA transferases/carnitine dehydratase